MENTERKEDCCISLGKNKVDFMKCYVLRRMYEEYIARLSELSSLSEEDARKMCGG